MNMQELFRVLDHNQELINKFFDLQQAYEQNPDLTNKEQFLELLQQELITLHQNLTGQDLTPEEKTFIKLDEMAACFDRAAITVLTAIQHNDTTAADLSLDQNATTSTIITNHASAIQQLPPVMFDHIAKYLPMSDLHHLGMSSKQLQEYCEEEFHARKTAIYPYLATTEFQDLQQNCIELCKDPNYVLSIKAKFQQLLSLISGEFPEEFINSLFHKSRIHFYAALIQRLSDECHEIGNKFRYCSLDRTEREEKNLIDGFLKEQLSKSQRFIAFEGILKKVHQLYVDQIINSDQSIDKFVAAYAQQWKSNSNQATSSKPRMN